MCAFVCSVYDVCARQICAVCVHRIQALFLWFTQMGHRDCLLCCMHYLIRVNFSNNPLLLRVDHKKERKTELICSCCLVIYLVSIFKFRFYFIIVYTEKLLF